MHVIVTGSLGYDYIMNFSGRFADRIMPDNIHKISLSFLADKLNKQFGGTAGNIAYTLSLLGIEPRIVSVAGNDFSPYAEFLKKHGIDRSRIMVVKREPTSCYFVVTDKDDNQIGSFYVGAQKFAKKLTLGADAVKAALTVISPQDPISMKQLIKECKKRGLRYLYDPAFQIDVFSAEDLKEGIDGAEILIGNDYELDLMCSKLGVSHEELLVMGPKVVVTTLGPKGAIIETRKDAMHIRAAKPKNTSDPTGAGDAFRGGFVAGFVRGFPLDVCGQMGAVAAVYTVEKYGTVTHQYTKNEFMKRYEDNYRERLAL